MARVKIHWSLAGPPHNAYLCGLGVFRYSSRNSLLKRSFLTCFVRRSRTNFELNFVFRWSENFMFYTRSDENIQQIKYHHALLQTHTTFGERPELRRRKASEPRMMSSRTLVKTRLIHVKFSSTYFQIRNFRIGRISEFHSPGQYSNKNKYYFSPRIPITTTLFLRINIL